MSLVTDSIAAVIRHSAEQYDFALPESLESSGGDAERTAPDGFVPRRMIHRAFEFVTDQFDQKPVGLVMAEYFEMRHLGVVARVSHHCETLREAVCSYLDYQELIHPNVAHHERRESQGWDGIIVEPTAEPTLASTQEMRVSFGFAFAMDWSRRLLDDDAIEAEAVHFAHHDSTHHDAYAEHFGAPITLGCEQNRLWFDSEVFDRPIVGPDTDSRPYLEELAERRIDDLQEDFDAFDDVISKVSDVLREHLASGRCTQKEVARRLGMSRRTLQRRLEEHDYSYTELRDEVREQRAHELLAEPDRTIRSIAHELGYSQISSFHRAFKRWTGQTPSEAREHMLRNGGSPNSK